MFDMTEYDRGNTHVPEQIACYAKEIFDNMTNANEVGFKLYIF